LNVVNEGILDPALEIRGTERRASPFGFASSRHRIEEDATRGRKPAMSTILIIILIILLIGGLPTWPYSSGWGYYPSGGIGLILLIIIILALMGRL
jgi:hypothetical protein